MKNYNLPLIILFCSAILIGSVVDIAAGDREFSDQENRVLSQKPAFSMGDLIAGKYTSDYEKYITDQFVGRDQWIVLKSLSETVIGKSSNNGIYICKDDTLIPAFLEPDAIQVDKNVEGVNRFAEAMKAGTGDGSLLDDENQDARGIPVFLTLIPTASTVWEDKLPYGAPNYDQRKLIADVRGKLSADVSYIDSYEELYSHRSEAIYYRTDHHWTTLGAYYGYRSLGEGLGFTPVGLAELTPEVVSTDFYGTSYSTSGVRLIRPDEIQVYTNPKTSVTNYEKRGQPSKGLLYDSSFLNKKDQYRMFLGGNHPLTVIVNEEAKSGADVDTTLPRLLVIKDSYANSELPFLISNYSEIHLIDLRYAKEDLKAYVRDHQIDQVLITYSVNNFASDANVYKLGITN